jgi:tape measure domain-containing protein
VADPKLTIRIGADLAEIKRALASLSGDLNKFKADAAKPGPGGGALGGVQQGIGRATVALKGLVGAFLGFQGLSAFVRIADQVTVLNARLKLATKTQEEFNRAQAGTFELAQRTRTSLTATVELYARLERSTRDLNVNQATLLQLTETINQAAQLSGGGPGAEAALFQLSQGLAAGQLRGEELNSILEQTPRLAEAIADGLGLPIGQLRALAQEGGLTAETVARALLETRDKVASEFSQLPRTVAGAFTQLSNSVARIVDRVNRETGITDALIAGIDVAVPLLEGLANFVTSLAKQFRDATQIVREFWQAYIDGGSDAAAVDQAVGDSISDLVGRIGRELQILPVSIGTIFAVIIGEADKFSQRLEFAFIRALAGGEEAWESIKLSAALQFAAIESLAASAVDFILGKFAEVNRQAADLADAAGLDGVATRLRAGAEAYENLGGSADRARDRAAAASAEYAKNVGVIRDTVLAFERELDAGLAASDAVIGQFLGDREAALEAIKAKAEAAGDAVGKVGLGGGNGAGTGGPGGLADQATLLRDSIDRALAELDRLYEEGEVGLREYFQRKAALQTQALDLAIAQAQAEAAVATTADAQSKALTEIVKLQRDRAEVGPRVAREQAQAEEDLARKLEDVRDRLAELNGDSTAGRRRALEREREELLQAVGGDAESTELVDRLFNLEVVRARLSAIRDQVSTVLTGLREGEDNAAALTDAGLQSPNQGEIQLQELRDRSLQQLVALREATRALWEETKDPEVLTALQSVDAELARVAASQETFKNAARDGAIDSLGQLFTDLATGARSFGDAVKAAAVSFIQSLARMAAEALAKRIILSAFSAFGPSVTPAVGHGGMRVGAGGMRGRAFNPMTWAGAPRYHNGSGGPLGLKAGELPAILQTGEEVLSRTDPRNAANASLQRPAPGYRILNVMDPGLVEDYLTSAEGEQVVLNIIGRNPGYVQQLRG